MNPWTSTGAALESPRGVHKLVHVAMQVMCSACPANQAYFGRRCALARAPLEAKAPAAITASDASEAAHANKDGGGGSDGFVNTLWMDLVLQQLEDALGPAVTLSKLLSANEQLLQK